jgi:hypothetical protein
MPLTAPTSQRFDWRLPIHAVILAPVLFIPLVLWSADFGPIFYFFPVAPLVCLVLLITFFLSKHQKPAIACMLLVYCASSWILDHNAQDIRSHLRWPFQSHEYKTKLLAQPVPTDDELRHIAWERYGWVTINTDIDLVYDPNDVLLNQLSTHDEGKFSGIPCPVRLVHRLEPHWFTVQFYTSTSWNECSPQ